MKKWDHRLNLCSLSSAQGKQTPGKETLSSETTLSLESQRTMGK